MTGLQIYAGVLVLFRRAVCLGDGGQRPAGNGGGGRPRSAHTHDVSFFLWQMKGSWLGDKTEWYGTGTSINVQFKG